MAVRVVTFNAEHARRTDDGTPDVDALAAAIAGLEPDVVALQEVDQGGGEAGGVDQPGSVAAAIGGRSVFAPLHHDGVSGVAVVARGAIDEVEVLRFASRRGHARGWRGRVPLWRPDRRAALVARVTVDGTAVRVTSAHLHLVRSVSAAQLEVLVARLTARPGPHVLMGDLNRWSGWVAPTAAAVGLSLVADGGPTHPAARPVRRIDHVAVGGLEVTAAEVVALGVSDHRALVVDLAPPVPCGRDRR